MPEMTCRECSVMHDATKHTPVPFVIPCARHALADELAEALKLMHDMAFPRNNASEQLAFRAAEDLLSKYEKAVKGEYDH